MRLQHAQWAAPFLVALHLPLFMFATNVHAFLFREVYTTGLAAILIAALVSIAGYRLTGDRGRTVALAAGVVAWCSWYGVFSYSLAMYLTVGPLAGGRTSVAVVPWSALWALYALVVLRARSFDVAATGWLLASLVLVTQPLAAVGAFAIRQPHAHVPPPDPVALRAAPRLPDIIHIIFDRYASATVLRTRYLFDNSPLTEQLRARGFTVADRSNANYFKTGLSLAATLNHTYLNDRFAGLEATSDWRPVYRLLEEHSVWRSLKPLGYDYVHLGSWWEPTRYNANATDNRSYAPIPHFAHWLYRNTPFADLGVSMGGMLDARREQWNRIHRQLKDLEKIRAGDRPLFAFVHFLLPHDPYVFGPRGEFLPPDVVKTRTVAENYVNHIRFANVALLQLVDRLMMDSARPKPIIIVQADEGPLPPRYDADTLTFDWRQATPEELHEKFGILNAMYLPGVTGRGLHPGISPVNTYRVVFNEYFGTNLDILPDRSFVSVGDRKPYQFIDATEVLSRGYKSARPGGVDPSRVMTSASR
jgi:hypothetical protein